MSSEMRPPVVAREAADHLRAGGGAVRAVLLPVAVLVALALVLAHLHLVQEPLDVVAVRVGRAARNLKDFFVFFTISYCIVYLSYSTSSSIMSLMTLQASMTLSTPSHEHSLQKATLLWVRRLSGLPGSNE